MPLEALIFDVDGTLAETEEAHRQAFNEIFAAGGLGWHWDSERYRHLLKTTGGKERMHAHAIETGCELSPSAIANMHLRKTQRYGEIIAGGGVELRPGIADLIDWSQRAGLQLAIATTTSRPNVDALCRAIFSAPADKIFHAIAAGDEVARKKPHPDVFLLALERLGLPARSCLALEDSRNGLLSAIAAGIPTVVSPSRYTAGEDFTGAVAVIDSFEEIGDPAAIWQNARQI